MNQNETEEALKEVLAAVLGHEVMAQLTRADEPSWDSLKHMQIVFAVEERFGVQFTEQEIPRLDSLSSFVQHLRAHYATQH